MAVPTTIEENGHLNTCCVCEAPVPVDGMAYIRVKCCGRTLHKECKERFYGELGRHHCPHCRVPFPTNDKELVAQLHVWADRGKAW